MTLESTWCIKVSHFLTHTGAHMHLCVFRFHSQFGICLFSACEVVARLTIPPAAWKTWRHLQSLSRTRGSPPAVWPTNAASRWTPPAPDVPVLIEAEFLQMKVLCVSEGVCVCVCATLTAVRLQPIMGRECLTNLVSRCSVSLSVWECVFCNISWITCNEHTYHTHTLTNNACMRLQT